MSDAIKIHAPVTYKKIRVPNYIIHETPPRNRSEGIQEAPKTAVADLSREAVDALANAWLTDFYTEAGFTTPDKERA